MVRIDDEGRLDPSTPIPQVWWWSQGEDPEAVRRRVDIATAERASGRRTGAAASSAYVDEAGEPGRRAVVVDLPPGAAADGLRILRSTLGSVRPSWAALQPAGGLAVPGMDPDLPMTGVLVNPWVSREWAGDGLTALERVFGGAYREELADGVLWVTDPRLAPPADATRWGDEEARWELLVEAAGVLGTIARTHHHQ